MLLNEKALQLAEIVKEAEATPSSTETVFAAMRTKKVATSKNQRVSHLRRQLYVLRPMRRNTLVGRANRARTRSVVPSSNCTKRLIASTGSRKQAVSVASAAYLRARANAIAVIAHDENKEAEIDKSLLRMSIQRGAL